MASMYSASMARISVRASRNADSRQIASPVIHRAASVSTYGISAAAGGGVGCENSPSSRVTTRGGA